MPTNPDTNTLTLTFNYNGTFLTADFPDTEQADIPTSLVEATKYFALEYALTQGVFQR